MKRHKILKAMLTLVVLALSLIQGLPVSAWGPERPTYTMNEPSDHPTFNSITDNNELGDERDFVRIVDKGTGGAYSSDIELEAGKDYEVYIGYHNNAADNLNDKAHDRQGVAWNVRLATNFPAELATGQKGEIQARISASNTDPESVWDEAYVTAKQAITLHYVVASARIYNGWKANGSVLSTDLFSDQGTFLGMDELNGMIYGCAAYSGHVLYTIRTVAVGDPMPDDLVDPTSGPPTSENLGPEQTPGPDEFDAQGPTPTPVVPSELPKTRSVEYIIGFMIILVIVVGVAYAIKSNRAYKKAAGAKKEKKK